MNLRILLLISLIVTTTAAGQVYAATVTRDVSYRHADTELQGFLAYDDAAKGARPGILIVHEWWGLNDYARRRAEQLAAMGYVAFAVDMYGKGKVTRHPDKAGEWSKTVTQNTAFWRKRVDAGLAVLRQQPQTDTSRIAAIGYCFGGGTVQQLAYSGADIDGVVSFHGSLLTPPAMAGKTVKAKILICHGAADSLNPLEKVKAYLASMEAAELDYQFVAYGGAKHSFTNPEAAKANLPILAYSPSADHRSWQHMRAFFEELWGGATP
jgi:dienelactone hydrolase